MAIELRNEVAIDIGGKSRVLRADFRAICAMESFLRMGVVTIVGRFQQKQFGLTDVAALVFFGLQGADDKDLTMEQVGDAIIETGIDNIISPVIDFALLMMKGVSLGKSQGAQAKL
jgi:hypothetical protein